MSPADMVGVARRAVFGGEHIIHAVVVSFVVAAATIYAVIVRDHTDNVWIVYGSAIGYAAGRSGTQIRSSRRDDGT